jgi:hypothetical protein
MTMLNNLQTSTATVLGEARWPTLKTLAEASKAIGIEEQRLLDLADAQLAPHWRIETTKTRENSGVSDVPKKR